MNTIEKQDLIHLLEFLYERAETAGKQHELSSNIMNLNAYKNLANLLISEYDLQNKINAEIIYDTMDIVSHINKLLSSVKGYYA